MRLIDLKYSLYEHAVQEPRAHIPWFQNLYTELRGRPPRRLREDFCGSFYFSSEWVKRDPRNTAIALDLDPVPLASGKRRHFKTMTDNERSRLRIRRQDVISVTKPLSDLAYAGNFSFNTFKDTQTLTRYFSRVLRSLDDRGVFILEMAGGPGFIEKGTESKRFTRGRKPWFTYSWEQKDFDPITHVGLYSIHFRLPTGRSIRDAFVYDWRIWSIPELRDALRIAGFRKTIVLWEQQDEDGMGSSIYLPSERGDNAHSWLAYILALKS